MTADDFRRITLAMPDAVEGAHMRHPDFRVGKTIFATLGYPDDRWGMVKLTPEQQGALVAALPHAFQPATGAWGRGGSTLVRLDALDEALAFTAIRTAWAGISAPHAPPHAGGSDQPERPGSEL